MGDPESLGVIPDGNRRYARKYGINIHDAYMKGIQTAERLMNYITERTRTKYIYFYTLSIENVLKRSKAEIEFLLRAFDKKAKDVLLNNPWNARVKFIGRRSLLPKWIQKTMNDVERKTEGNNGPIIVLAMAYTGLAEVTDMVKSIAQKVKNGALSVEDIDEETVYAHLYAPDVPPPDAIVRTSGEQRLSGFLPIQSVYSELIFYPKLWPELEYEDMDKIFNEFRSRERRFGQ